MKIFLGGYGRCSVHNEKDMIRNICKKCNVEETEYIEEADIILLIDTCAATREAIDIGIGWLHSTLKYKKKNAKIIVSGCLSEKINVELTEKQEEVLKKFTWVKSNDIIEYIANIINYEADEETHKDFAFPFTIYNNNSFIVSPVSGCLNHCSFCKKNYMDFPLKSNPIEDLQRMADDINRYDLKFPYICINSSNLSLYGVDLYRKQLAHEAIKVLTSPKNIKYANVGALINWYPELMKEILENGKIKNMMISLESGSPRIYELMNRPISFDNLIKVIKRIRQERPDIIIDTEIIVGYPTETIDDLKRSIDLIYELDIYPLFVHSYTNSKEIPSSKLPQHSKSYGKECEQYALRLLQKQKDSYIERMENSEMFITDKYDEYQVYQAITTLGKTINIGFNELDRVYQINEFIPENTLRRVRKK